MCVQGQGASSTFTAECRLADPNAPILYDRPIACVVPFVTGNATVRVTLQGLFETAQGIKTSLTCNGTSLFVAGAAVVNGFSAVIYGAARAEAPSPFQVCSNRATCVADGEGAGASAVGYVLKGQTNWAVSGRGWSPELGVSSLSQLIQVWRRAPGAAALSAPDGRLSTDWSMHSARLRWSDGPPCWARSGATRASCRRD
jgi:hypothetical protein